MRTSGNRMSRSLLLIALAAGALLLLLVAATPALAADGVQVWQGKDMASAKWQGETQLADNLVVWTQKDDVITGGGGYQYQVYLADLATGAFLQLHADMAMEQHDPHIAVQDDGTITVVWDESYNDSSGYHSHVWIWQGTEQGSAFVPTPDPSNGDGVTSVFPHYLVMGRYDYPAEGDPIQVECDQSSPRVGLVNEPDSGVPGKHIVVAWEDGRDFGVVPEVYYADLTSGTSTFDSSTDLWATGTAVDLTDVLARGQHEPEVGPKGVFWLDDRYSYWTNSGEMMATDVRFSDFASGGPDPTTPSVSLYNDVPSNDDNAGLVASAGGAAWLHSGPYANGQEEPFAAKVGSGAALLTTTMLPSGYTTRALNAAWVGSSANTYYALVGLHGNSTTGDEDIFFYDPATGARVPVCDRGQTGYTDDPAGRTAWFDNTSNQPAISVVPDLANPGAHLPFERVVWMDGKLNTVVDPEEDGMTQLFEAFVPSVSLKPRASSLLRLHTDTIVAAVAPNFQGKNVSLQLVKRVAVLGQTQYKFVRTLGTKAMSSASSASFTWKPTVKGTYYVRAWFGGGTKYYADGSATAPTSGFDYQIPHVGNYSKVFRIVVK